MKTKTYYILICGLALAVIYILPKVLLSNISTWISLLLLLLEAATIVYFQLSLRTKYYGGSVKYGRILSDALLAVVVATVLATLYTYISFSNISPSEMNTFFGEIQNELQRNGITGSMQRQVIGVYRKMFTPSIMAITTFISYFLGMLILSLITSGFTKKNSSSSFDNAMKQIEE